ncbi:transducin beta-like protein 3 [Quercus suber]|uniref:Transducin beta-like protein 3 n=1 Tax=Quercus suber TaxID=58331 RepID=A0AAW0KTT1_QUESU
MLATGGSDAVINLWYDCTSDDKEEAFRKEEEGVLKGQELENAVSDADYTKAIQIAFELRRPHKLFELFAELFRKREAENQMDKALNAIGKGEFRLLFEYVREWNTKPKLCHVAQFVLFRVFSILPPTEIIEVVNLWDLHDYGFKKTVLTYEVLEAVCTIRSGSPFASSLALFSQQSGMKASGSSEIHFITVGERGIVRIWNSERAVCLFEQKSSDITDSSDMDRGFTSAVMLPFDQGLLCVTADQQFLFYSPVEHPEEMFKLILSRRLVGYNEEIVDMKFLGEEEQFLAVATNLEQVRVYDLTAMSCSYVLAGHTETVLCLDTCVSSSGRTLIVTGSKDNNVRLWESESRCCVGVGVGHMGAVGAVAFSKKQKNFFVSGSR